MKRTLFVLAALALAGCEHHPVDCALGIGWHDCLPGSAGYRPPPVDSEAMCRSYGYVAGTPEYADCRKQLDLARINAAGK